MYHERTKHIDVTMHFILDVITQDDVFIEKISTLDTPTINEDQTLFELSRPWKYYKVT